MNRVFRVCVLLFVCGWLRGLCGQDLDSLRQVAKTTKNDTLRIQLLKTIGEEEGIFRISYWDSLRIECERKLESCAASEKYFFKKYLALAINNVGYVADEQGNSALAIECYEKSVVICKEINDTKGLSKAYNNIGSIYMDLGDASNALSFYHKSLKIKEQAKDEKGVAIGMNNIGQIFFKQKAYDQAQKYYRSSVDILLKLNDRQLLAIVYSNIGLVYMSQKRLAEAQVEFEKARSAQVDIKDEFNLTTTLSNLASLYLEQNKPDEALALFEETLVLQRKLDYKRGIANTLGNLSRIFYNKGRLKEALQYAKQDFEISRELGYPESISSSSKLLSTIYEKMGHYKLAFEMQVLHEKMSDSLINLENRKASIQKGLQYQYEKKTAADSIRIEADKKVTEARFKEEKTQRFALYGGLFMLLILALVIFNRLRVSKKQNLIIEHQKLQVELKNEEVTHQKELVEEKQREIIDSINYARRIQQAVLTGEEVWNKVSEEHFILFKPKDIVSGDFYWAYNTPSGHSVFALADCTGHGVPGGFMSMLGNSFLNEIVVEKEIVKADEILNRLRAKIIAALEQKGMTEQKDGMDISLCVWNKADNSLEFAGANNPLWILRGEELIEYKADKMPIGAYLETEIPFRSTSISLQKGDTIYLSTDGYADQFGGDKGKKLKYKPFMDLLIRVSRDAMAVQKAALDKAFEEWRAQYEQVDDVSIIGIRV